MSVSSKKSQKQEVLRKERGGDPNEQDNAITTHSNVPITAERPVPSDLDEIIEKPGVPRAYDAPSTQHPNGIRNKNAAKGTPLMQHVDFFDLNGDGIITPPETFSAFRRIGFNFFFSLLAVMVIHFGFAYVTQDSWIPDPRLYIHVKNIHKCKHGSDSEAYDTEGRFVPQKMEEVFSKYDKEGKGYLTFSDVWTATEASRNAMDPFGWFAAKFEWGTLYLLCATDGKLYKEDVRSCFDGTLFYKKESQQKAKAF